MRNPPKTDRPLAKPANAGESRRQSGLWFRFIVVVMNLVVIPMTVLMTVASILVSPLAFCLGRMITGKRADHVVRILIWLYGQAWLLIIRLFVRIEKENLTPENIRGGTIFVVNHESFFDTYCMGLLPLADICFAVRAWPFRIVFYRPFMTWSRYLNVEEMSWGKTLEAGRARLSEGSALLFFPEGHRSRNGSLGKYYSGAFKIAVETGVPVVPLCLTGTGDLLPPGRPWLEPARIKIKALPPVSPDDFRDFEFPHIKLRQHVHDLMRVNLSLMKNR